MILSFFYSLYLLMYFLPYLERVPWCAPCQQSHFVLTIRVFSKNSYSSTLNPTAKLQKKIHIAKLFYKKVQRKNFLPGFRTMIVSVQKNNPTADYPVK